MACGARTGGIAGNHDFGELFGKWRSCACLSGSAFFSSRGRSQWSRILMQSADCTVKLDLEAGLSARLHSETKRGLTMQKRLLVKPPHWAASSTGLQPKLMQGGGCVCLRKARSEPSQAKKDLRSISC